MSTYVTNTKGRLLADPTPKKPSKALSSGLTLINLAMTGELGVGFRTGHCYTFTGRASSGKTWLLLQTLAEACLNKRFRKHVLLYDAPERGALMDYKRYFGQLSERIEEPEPSVTSEQFYARVLKMVKLGPTIYGLDSEDALQCEAEMKRLGKADKARDKGTSGGGSFGTEKAKANSAGFRRTFVALSKHNSILIMIKQARQNINPLTSKFKPDTRSGGTAIGFFASIELWFKKVGKIRKTILKRKRTVGSLMQIRVEKNRLGNVTEDHTVTIPFFRSLGFDEVGSLVRWLCEEEVWSCKGKLDDGGKIAAFGMTETWDKMAEKIEAKGMTDKLRNLVVERWREIEEASKVKRRVRYV